MNRIHPIIIPAKPDIPRLSLLSTLSLLAICTVYNAQSQTQPYTQFHPKADSWKDNNGIHINAHGGGYYPLIIPTTGMGSIK